MNLLYKNLNYKKVELGITILWYINIIYYSLHMVSRIYYLITQYNYVPYGYSMMLKTSILHLPVIYCIYQFKRIMHSLTNDTFYTTNIAQRFRKIAYAIFSINLKILVDMFHKFQYVITTDYGKGVLITDQVFSLSTTLTLGFIFLLVSKILREAIIMKDEIDQTV